MPNETLMKRLRDAGNDYTIAWGSGELYDEAAEEIERLKAELERIKTGIGADRCDGETEYAAGVNAACCNHLALIDTMSAGLRGVEGEPIVAQSRTAGLVRAAEIVQAEIDRSEALLNIEEGGSPIFDRGQTEAGIAALRTVANAIRRERMTSAIGGVKGGGE